FSKKRSASVGNSVHLFSLDFADRHKATVLQHLESRVDRACAGCVHAASALLQSLHHLVAMHRALRQQFQQRVFQIPTAKKALAPARKPGPPLPEGPTVADRPTWAKRPTWTKGPARPKEPPPHVQAEERPLVPAMPPPAAPLVPAAAPPRPVISVSALV